MIGRSSLLLFLSTLVAVQGFLWNATLHENMLQYSSAAYCPQAELASWSCTHCQSSSYLEIWAWLEDSTTNTFGFVGVANEGWIVVTFRGTQPSSLKNWITDLSFATLTAFQDVPNAKVHAGFLNAYLTVSEDMLSAVSSLATQYPNFPVYVTGHSLGAALSVLAAIDIKRSLGIDPIVYNYGDPRVGNQAFAQYFDQQVPNLWRVVNEADIVPHLPPKILKFYHVATEVWYNDNTFHFCDHSGEDPNCSDSQIDLSIPDHITYMGVALGHGAC